MTFEPWNTSDHYATDWGAGEERTLTGGWRPESWIAQKRVFYHTFQIYWLPVRHWRKKMHHKGNTVHLCKSLPTPSVFQLNTMCMGPTIPLLCCWSAFPYVLTVPVNCINSPYKSSRRAAMQECLFAVNTWVVGRLLLVQILQPVFSLIEGTAAKR